MGVHIKECEHCGEGFTPHRRLGKRQRTCGKDVCRQWLAAENKRQWIKNNREYYAGPEEQQRLRQWAADRTYWKDYRRTHPDYVERNRMATRERMKARRAMFAKQDSIRKDPVGYLQGLRRGVLFAKQDSIKRTLYDLILYVEAPLVRFAKQDSMDAGVRVAE